METHIHRLAVFPHCIHSAVRQHEICPSSEVGALVCFTPGSPSSLLSSILQGSALLWGPIRPLCRSMACGYPGSRVTQSTPAISDAGFSGIVLTGIFKSVALSEAKKKIFKNYTSILNK